MTKLLEVVRLTDGSYVLQSDEEGAKPFVKIEFSEQVEAYFEDRLSDIVQAMIGAGLEATQEISESFADDVSVQPINNLH